MLWIREKSAQKRRRKKIRRFFFPARGFSHDIGLETGWPSAPQSPRLDKIPQAGEPSPEPQVSATTPQTSDVGAGKGRLLQDARGAPIVRPESSPSWPRESGVRRAPGGRGNTHLGLPRLLGKPPTARRRGRAVRGSRRRGSRALPSPNHSARFTDAALLGPTVTSPRRRFSSPRI